MRRKVHGVARLTGGELCVFLSQSMYKLLTILTLVMLLGAGCASPVSEENPSIGLVNQQQVSNEPAIGSTLFQNPQTDKKIQALQEQLDATKKELDSLKKNSADNNNTSAVVAKWRPQVALITCSWFYAGTAQYLVQSGSGLLYRVPPTDTIVVATNRHVFTDPYGNSPTKCSVKFPDDVNFFDVSSATPSENGTDFGLLGIKQPDEYLISIASRLDSKSFLCIDKPEIGDSVVILGYPVNGSSTDITATEGIISGFDGDYYITSAKVEHGDSGGAAILTSKNCSLGLPTSVVPGQLESLARILPWQITAK